MARTTSGRVGLLLSALIAVTAVLYSQRAEGAMINATPSNYQSLLGSLRPGDTLVLAAGNYSGLPVYNLNGTYSSPITITGPASGPTAVILGSSGANTVRLDASSYVVVKNLEVNCRNLGGDGVNSQGITHHITLDNLYIHGFSDDQGTVGVSTNSAPVWNWTIRNCVIADGGTGMYLGNSDGNQPFIAGIIENNLIYDTIGYNIEIKQQNPRPTNIPGMPTGDSRTILRNNVFGKGNNAYNSTGDRARPNVLVGHLPLSGVGMNDVYEVYGNFFYQNPTGEPLFQGEGNVALYSNIFYNSVGEGVWIQPHNDLPKSIRIFNNTLVVSGTGIKVSGGDPSFQQKVIGNAVFAGTPLAASDKTANITDTFANAALYLARPTGVLGQMDLYPKPGSLSGTSIDTVSFNTFDDWGRDFNGNARNWEFRGAYSGEGTNPGWIPKLERKPVAPTGSPPPDAVPPSSPTNLKVY